MKKKTKNDFNNDVFFEGAIYILCFNTRHKSRLSHANILLCHYGGQLKAVVEQKAGEKKITK